MKHLKKQKEETDAEGGRILKGGNTYRKIRGFHSIESLPNQANWSSLFIGASLTETNKDTVKDDDNHEALENIVDEVVSTFNPDMEGLESSSNSIVLDNVAHPEFFDFLK